MEIADTAGAGSLAGFAYLHEQRHEDQDTELYPGCKGRLTIGSWTVRSIAFARRSIAFASNL